MFATIANFILLRLLNFKETFQLPNRFIKSPPPPPPPPPFIKFLSNLLLSCPVPSASTCALRFYPAPPSTHQPPPLPVRVAPVPSPAAHRRRSLLGSDSHQHTGATPICHLQFPTARFSFPAMVRTRGAHRYRPRVQFSAPKRDGACTSKATTTNYADLVTETPPALALATSMIQGPAPASIS